MDTYDYVIVGAGSAGSAVAGRLTASGRHRVLLLEAGPSDMRFWIQVPIGYGTSYYNPAVNWMYQSEPIPGLADRTVYVPRGKVIGGSSSINAMVYSRGQAGDFDDWEAKGNPGWGWKDVLEVYRRLEDHDLGAGPWHGKGGPLHVTTIADEVHPLARVFVEAGKQVGAAYNPDLNGETIEGVGFYQINTRNGLRMSSSRAYLWPAKGRRNLRIETGALATRIMLEGKRAVGVEYRQNGKLVQVRAGREVILSGGSINSPQLLQLSGIGPTGLLKDLGIEVRHDSPAVGRNLQDHICYDHVYRASRPSLNQTFGPWYGKLWAGMQYVLTRRGPLSLSINQGGGYVRMLPGATRPTTQLYFAALTYERAPPVRKRRMMSPDPFPGFTTSVSPCRPTSRGYVEITSSDPNVAPRIQPNFLSTNDDVEEVLAGARYLRRLAATPALRSIIAEELKPGPRIETDAELVADIRGRSYSVFHPVSSCRMGPDARENVVDHRLRVHGLEGLRVIDASIFPTVTSGNTNAPAIMVGEKGADLLLEDAA